MVGVFREGHTKRPSRRHEPLIIGPPAVSWKRRFAIGLVLVGAATAALLLFSKVAQAHPSPHVHAQVLERPIAGVRNDYWYDYRSDVEEAEIELHKDLRRAKTAQDKREAWATTLFTSRAILMFRCVWPVAISPNQSSKGRSEG
jgi:hypothetical protein